MQRQLSIVFLFFGNIWATQPNAEGERLYTDCTIVLQSALIVNYDLRKRITKIDFFGHIQLMDYAKTLSIHNESRFMAIKESYIDVKRHLIFC